MDELFLPGALVFDLIFSSPPPGAALAQVLGPAASLFGVAEADEAYERENPRGFLQKPGDKRLIVGQVRGAPLSESPDLRPFLQVLVALVVRTGARLGTMGAWKGPSFLGVVAKERADLLGLALLLWLEDDTVGLDFGPAPSGEAPSRGQKRAELEKKREQLIASGIDAQLGALPAGPYWVLDLLGKLGTASEDALSDWLKKAFRAFQSAAAAERPRPKAPPPAPPKAALKVGYLGQRPILLVPKERFSLSLFEGITRGRTDVLHSIDAIPSQVQEEVAKKRVPFLAELPILGELFLEGKPLTEGDARSLAEEIPGAGGALTFLARLPRFGQVRVLSSGGGWYVVSDEEIEPASLLPVLGSF